MAEALPGYTCHNMSAKGRSLWFYYQGPTRIGGRLPSLELQIRFNDGLPVAPLVNCWIGEKDIFGPVTDFVGDEAIAFDQSLGEPDATGVWIKARVGSRFLFLRDGDATFPALTRIAQALAAALPTLPLPTSFELDASEQEPPNPEYLALDRAMFARVTPGLLANPPQIDALTRRESFSQDPDLGFGYRLESRVAGGGYLSLYGSVLRREVPTPTPPPSAGPPPPGGEADPPAGAFEAMQISTYLPRAPAPPEVYREFFHPIFGPAAAAADTRLRRYWGYDLAVEPLPAGLFRAALPGTAELADHPDRATVDWLMTPFSGTTFFPVWPRRFASLFTRLDARVCLFLLRSKNPATRLTAVGMLRRHAAEWKTDLAALAPDFELIYRSVPVVLVQRGDVVRRENARVVVDQFVARAE